MDDDVASRIDLDTIAHFAAAVRKRFIQRDTALVSGDPDGRRDRRVEPEYLAQNHVEVRERVQFVHAGGFGVYGQQLFAKFLLDFGCLCESVESPCGPCTAGLVARNKESVSASISRWHD